MTSMPFPIYVIGSSNTDMVVKTERLPVPGETMLGGSFLMNAGGKGANQAVAAARLGGHVTFVGCIGDDSFGHETINQLNKEGIRTDYVLVDTQQPSGVALINVDAQGENSIVVAPGANACLLADRLEGFFNQLQRPAIVLVQLEIPIITVEYIIQQCAVKSIPVILNPAPAQQIRDDLMPYLYAITPNESEAELLTGHPVTDEYSACKASEILHRKGVDKVIITLGKKGAFWSDGHSTGVVPSPIVQAVDTTAAGDCFNGALAVALSESLSLPEAIAFACTAASISVTYMGAQTSLPTLQQVAQFKSTLQHE
jgi:ribokinase